MFFFKFQNQENLTAFDRVMEWVFTIFGAAFNLLLVLGVLFILMDVTGSRPSAKATAPTSVTEGK